MAKILEVKMINASCVTAKMAGRESSAKTRSAVSTINSASASGVSARRPCQIVASFWPSKAGATGERRRKKHGQREPGRGPAQRLLEAHHAGAAVKHPQVKPQRNPDARDEGGPVPGGDLDRREHRVIVVGSRRKSSFGERRTKASGL